MTEWVAALNVGSKHLLAFAVVFATLLLRYGLRLFFNRLARRFANTKNLYDDALLDAVRRPLGWLVWILGILYAIEILGTDTDYELLQYVDPARQVTVIVLFTWFAVRFIRFVEQHITQSGYRERPIDETTATAVGKLLRAAVIITSALTVLQTLGFSIAGVLAFGGIGGIAIGFAARDLLANFFGGLMVFLDRPFSVGDWVRSPDRNVEGTVEEIGWRLTRIRTFDQRPLYIPNSVFATIALENPSRMLNRRIKEVIGVRYDDVRALPTILEEVRTYLQEHPDIDQSKTLMVHFDKFAESALEFFIYTFTRTTVWTEFHAIKERVLLDIAAIIEKHGAQVAFPTRTVMMESAEPDA
jgi:MscS family membrane protein